MSTKAIYNFITSSHGGPLEHHLYRKRVHKKGGPKRGRAKASDQTKVSIEKRPKQANNRTEFGHFEGDFMESGQDGRGITFGVGREKNPLSLYHLYRR